MERETKRKIIHISMGLWTIPLAFIGREFGLIIIIFALIFVLLIARPFTWQKAFDAMASREDERKVGYLKGPILYVVMIFFLVIFFDLRISAAMFAILAFGDGFANVIGSRYGGKRFQRFENKSLIGFFTFFIFAFITGLFSFIFIQLVAPYSLNPNFLSLFPILQIETTIHLDYLIFTCFLVSLVSAIIELITTKYINDNVSIPLVGAIMFTILL